jgi:hypothetical protein
MSSNAFLETLESDIRKEYNIDVEIITNELELSTYNELKNLSDNKVYILNKEDLMKFKRTNTKLYSKCKYILLYKQTEYYIANEYNIKVLLNNCKFCVVCNKKDKPCYVRCKYCNFTSCVKCKYNLYINKYITTNKVLCPWCKGEFVKEEDLIITDKIRLILQDLYFHLKNRLITHLEFAECERDLQLLLSKRKLITEHEYTSLRNKITGPVTYL